jgi:mRNA-degrading endonuclease RelE of RelBE toxin-antitoxin system
MECAMEFFEAPAFTRYLPRYLDDDQYRILQRALANTPDIGDLMPGTGGFRKLRWADVRRGKGRRGGLRIIYYWFDVQDRIWLMTIYDKSEAADLTPEQKRMLKAAIDTEKKSRRR